MTFYVTELKECMGKVISEYPYIKVLSIPQQFNGQWRALAIVNESLCIIELKIKEKE